MDKVEREPRPHQITAHAASIAKTGIEEIRARLPLRETPLVTGRSRHGHGDTIMGRDDGR